MLLHVLFHPLSLGGKIVYLINMKGAEIWIKKKKKKKKLRTGPLTVLYYPYFKPGKVTKKLSQWFFKVLICS